MITLEESEFLLQIAGSMKDQVKNLENAFNVGDYEKMKKIKEFIIKLQSRIDEILEKTKK